MTTVSLPTSILLVADDALWRDHLVQVLLEDGFQVEQRSGSCRFAELLPSTEQPVPQLLIVHIADVGTSVDRALNDLVKDFRHRDPAIPLLLLLDRGEEEQRAGLLDAGADDVLQSPFGLPEFVARCRAILRRSHRFDRQLQGPDPQAVLQVGSISLDRCQCRVTLAGQDVNLTPREFRLLECFMLNPGRTLSREQLIEKVWGPDYSGDSKSVDVHVLWLRRKLDVVGPRPQLFVTVRGIGYRLDPPRF